MSSELPTSLTPSCYLVYDSCTAIPYSLCSKVNSIYFGETCFKVNGLTVSAAILQKSVNKIPCSAELLNFVPAV